MSTSPAPTAEEVGPLRDAAHAAKIAGWLYKHRGAVWTVVAALAGAVGTAGTMLARHEARLVRLEEHRLATDVRQERIESVIERVENKVDRTLEGQARLLGLFEALPPHRSNHGIDNPPPSAAPATRRGR